MTRGRGLIVAAALCLGLVGCARADFQRGLAAYERGDYAAALRELRLVAAQGDARAQEYLGFMYASGRGVPRDDVEAVQWYRRAAEQGLAGAQYRLGLMYASGRGVSRDDAEAVQWYRRAAEQGLAGAQYALGFMYANGRGVSRDDAEAVQWYRRAAEQGQADAINNLGAMYAQGQGVPRDDVEAVYLYRRAADRGNAPAQFNLGSRYSRGTSVPRDCTEAVRWFREAAAQGFADGQTALGAMYEQGCGSPADDVQAYLWHHLAAAQGHEGARARRDALTGRLTPDQLALAQKRAHEWKPGQTMVTAPPSASPASRPSTSSGAPKLLPEGMIPRAVLFAGRGERKPRLSPDGTKLAYLASSGGVLNVWVRTVGRSDDQVVTSDAQADIRLFRWQCDGEHILYLQDRDGDENWHLYQASLKTRVTRDLTPFDDTAAAPVAGDCKYPDQVLFGLNLRDRRVRDVYRVHLKSGKLDLDTENPGDVVGWAADGDLQVRAARARTPSGEPIIRVRDRTGAPWRELQRWSADETFGSVVGFSADGKSLRLVSSVGASTGRLVQVDLVTGQSTVLAEDPKYDVDDVMIHPKTRHVEAVAFVRARREWTLIDGSLQTDFDLLRRLHDGDFDVVSRARDDRTWLVQYVSDDRPARYYLYDRPARTVTPLFTELPTLQTYRLVKMQPISFPARDGMVLHGYLTLPVDTEPKNLPMLLMVHGGPWERDDWGLKTSAQWLANRGYAVLQVNFRGSTGYGKAYLNAGDREWAGKMHTDLIDGRTWAVQQGYADPRRVCIMGGSYGGYATLVALAFTPDEFACGIAFAPLSNLVSHIGSFARGSLSKPVWDKRVGKVETEPEFLRSRSPLFKADRITAPLLIAHGANDRRVTRVESDLMVSAMRTSGKGVEYLVFPDEGHGFVHPENRLRFFAAVERFLAEHLGGRVELPSPGEDWDSHRRVHLDPRVPAGTLTPEPRVPAAYTGVLSGGHAVKFSGE